MSTLVNNKYFWILCGAIWPLFVTIIVLIYRVDMLNWDSWSYARQVIALHDGKYKFHELLKLHNSHPIVIPKILILTFSYLSHWNTLYEHLFSLFCSWALLLLVWRTIEKHQLSLWCLPLTSLIVFSLMQSQSWIWGWQIQIFLSVLCTCISFYFLFEENRYSFILALIFLWLASFSFGSGIVTGIAALFVISGSWKKYSIWLANLVLIGFLVYQMNDNPPLSYTGLSPLSIFLLLIKSIPDLIIFIAKSLGYFFIPLSREAGTYLVLPLLLLNFCLFIRFRCKTPFDKLQAISFCMIIFSVITTVLIAITRAYGVDDVGASPRYTTMYIPFWLAQVFLAFQFFTRYYYPLAKFLFVAFMLLQLNSNNHGFDMLKENHDRFYFARQAILDESLSQREFNQRVKRVCWYGCGKLMKERLEDMKRHNLLFYRK